MFQLRFSLLVVFGVAFDGWWCFLQTFGASVCIYKRFCDSTFLVLGEKSESEIVLHSFGVRALKSNLQLFAINPKN